MNTEERTKYKTEMTREIEETFSHIERLGIKILFKVQCIKCGKIYTSEEVFECVEHNIHCKYEEKHEID